MLVDYERATGGTVARLGDVLAVDGGWLGVHGDAEARTRGARVAIKLPSARAAPGSSTRIMLLRAGTAAADSKISDHFLTSAIHEEPLRPKSVGMSLRETGDF